VIRRRVKRRLLGVIGDDGTGLMWQRLSPDGMQVVRLAHLEARELGHPCTADEHVLLGILRHGTSSAAALLHEQGLDLTTARAALLEVGPTLGPRADPGSALRSVGIDVDQVRQRLEATFGADAVRAAERRVRRRPWWRGGYPRPNPLCGYFLAKRAYQFAADYADDRADTRIEPHHLLYGALRDAQDPLGTQLSRRSRTSFATLGWIPGRPNPLRLLLQARGIDPTALTAALAGTRS
jgi:ATP-dependent Clp protease ATP-binding subunit ClpA